MPCTSAWGAPCRPTSARGAGPRRGQRAAPGRDDWRRLAALAVLFVPVTFFWAGYEQQGNTIALWAENFTDRTVGFGAAIPVTWFQSFNPFMIFAFTPVVVALWARQARRGREPSSLAKMALGCAGLAAANLVMAAAAWQAGDGRASWLWLGLYFVILTLGELYLSPVSLSLVTKVAPAGLLSMVMGFWLATSFTGNFLAGWLGSFWSAMDKPGFFAYDRRPCRGGGRNDLAGQFAAAPGAAGHAARGKVGGMTDAPAPAPEEIVARCRALAPKLFERAPEAERLRRCPDESIADYFAIGLDRLLKPARYGGWEMGWDRLCETALALAHGCAAQGWVLTIYGDHTQHLGMFDRKAQDEVWDDPRALVSTSFGAQGAARPAPGGAVLSGKWSFSSGIDHASWIMAGSMLHPADGSEPQNVIFLLPKSEVEVIDDWHVMGLSGTGSKSFRIDEVFVPAHRMLDALKAAQGIPSPRCGNDAPIFRTPRRSTAGFALGCVGVGATQGMLDAFVAAQRGRVSRGIVLAEEQWMQLAVAEAAATLKSAALLAVSDARETMALVACGEAAPVERRADDKRDAAFIARLARDTADKLFGVAGGTTLHQSNPLQRYFRDIHAATAHFGLRWEHSAVPYARLILGLPPGPGYY